VSFEFLFTPLESADSSLTGLFDGAPLLVAMGIAVVLGLRHASDPDHLVAVTSLIASDHGDARAAARLGAWWGHAVTTEPAATCMTPGNTGTYGTATATSIDPPDHRHRP
jgi:hypothetical protein